jgi:hypothetical protein
MPSSTLDSVSRAAMVLRMPLAGTSIEPRWRLRRLPAVEGSGLEADGLEAALLGEAAEVGAANDGDLPSKKARTSLITGR